VKIISAEVLTCAAGTRYWSYLKVSTDEGITGWAEFTDGMLSAHGMAGVVRRLASFVIAEDPTNWRRIEQLLRSRTREAEDGLNRRAVGTVVNACVDIAARARGLSVAQLLGGPLREEFRLYWSHCGLGRIRLSQAGLAEPVRTLDDVRDMGAAVARAGFGALKTNLFVMGDDGAQLMLSSWGGPGWPDLEPDRAVAAGVCDVLDALGEGAGAGVELFIDVNHNVKGEGIARLAERFGEHGLDWFEVDSDETAPLAHARSRRGPRIASGETLTGLRAFRRLFEAGAVDVPIVDVAWNGLPEALRVADLAHNYDLNVVPHNYGSHLLTYMSAQFAALVPNFAIFEIDVEGVPWRDDVVPPPDVVGGTLRLPTGPGWGAEVDEDALRAHPVEAG
jgi:galactonate dehydratase